MGLSSPRPLVTVPWRAGNPQQDQHILRSHQTHLVPLHAPLPTAASPTTDTAPKLGAGSHFTGAVGKLLQVIPKSFLQNTLPSLMAVLFQLAVTALK